MRMEMGCSEEKERVCSKRISEDSRKIENC